MPYKACIIKTDGTREFSDHAKVPDYEFLSKAVGGFIETCHGFTQLSGTDAKRATAYCNEDGFRLQLPVNHFVSREWNTQILKKWGTKAKPQTLMGNVVIYWKVAK